jgi:hypothetical protein
LALVLMALAPAWAIWTEHQGSQAAIDPGYAIGCLPQSASTTTPGQHWRFSCPIAVGEIDHLELRVDLLPPHSNAGALVRLRRSVINDMAAENTGIQTLDDRPSVLWQQINTREPDQLAVVAGWVDGMPMRGGWQQRLSRARNSIAGATPPPMLISLSTPTDIKLLSPVQLAQLQQAMRGLLLRNRGFVDDLVAANAAPR